MSGLVAEILYTNEEQTHLLPLDMERTGEGVIHWLERRVIPKNRAFVDEILKTLGLSHNAVSYTHLDVYKRQLWRCWTKMAA